MKTVIKKYTLILMVTLMALPFSLFKKDISADETHPNVGVVTGTVFGGVVLDDNPNAQIEYYNSTFDLPIALESGKIDAYALDEPVAKLLCNIYTDQIISKKLSFEDYGILVNKSQTKLLQQLNEFIVEKEETGDLFEMQKKWFDSNDSLKKIDFKSIENNRPILNLAISSSLEPFDYVKDGEFAGYEVELVVSFCKEYGYGLEIEDSNFSGVIAAVTSGKSDLGACVATITEERAKTMDFTTPIYQGGTVYVKRKRVLAKAVNTLDDLKGKNIGVQTGAAYDEFLIDKVDSPKIEYYKLIPDMISSLNTNAISAFVVDKPVIEAVINDDSDEYKILDSLKEISYGIALPKNNDNSLKLYSELDEYIKESKNNGLLDEIYNIWVSGDNSIKRVDKEGLTGENGTITLAVSSSVGAPFTYIKNDEVVGCDIDIIYRFAREYGYDIKIEDYSIDGLFTAISMNKCDIGASGICITDERKESMYFPESYYNSECVVVVKNNVDEAVVDNSENGFFDDIVESFNKTFVKEDRWKLFASGIFTTVYVTLLSIVLGSILGFVVYMLYRNAATPIKIVMDAINNIIKKTPIVVLLMILYYIIFGNLGISGRTVSVIGLTIIFTNSVNNLIVMGVDSIDKSQYDAALALGYSKNKGFIRMILPQAIINTASGYKNAIINLIKDSSIVGYIAVQDLTKVGDIIRSRTYDAFFPLITTAIIYYIIATVFIALVDRIKIKGKHRK